MSWPGPTPPPLYPGQQLLDCGRSTVIRHDPISGPRGTIARLPGFTRGLDADVGVAFVGLSSIRESAIFGVLPIGNNSEDLRRGLAVVDPQSGALAGWFWFQSGVSEILSVLVLPGWRHRAPIDSDSRSDNQPTIWLEREVG